MDDRSEFDQLPNETLDGVAPRLRTFASELTSLVRASGAVVETMTVFLLNSTDHPVEVLGKVNAVEVQMNFDAIVPVWAPEPRARVSLRFNQGRTYYMPEVGKTRETARFPMRKVLGRVLQEVHRIEHTSRIQSAKDQKIEKGHEALERLARELNTGLHDSNTIKLKNAKVRRLDALPSRVIVLLSVTHDEAREILQKHPRS